MDRAVCLLYPVSSSLASRFRPLSLRCLIIESTVVRHDIFAGVPNSVAAGLQRTASNTGFRCII